MDCFLFENLIVDPPLPDRGKTAGPHSDRIKLLFIYLRSVFRLIFALGFLVIVTKGDVS